MENLTIKELETFGEALALRKIRNECRLFMTRDTSKISILQQFRWFHNSYKFAPTDQLQVFLFLLSGKPIGYGLIRDKAVRPLISGGLLQAYRGKGYGDHLFRAVTDIASSNVFGKGMKSVFLEVLETNTPAFGLYQKIGYVEKARQNGIIYMQKDYGEFD